MDKQDSVRTEPAPLEDNHQEHHGLACPVCRRTFRRAENLKRHVASHSKERKFQCSHPGCNKKFYRSDALHRHETVHHLDGKRRAARSLHACTHCAASRVKCSGEIPCTRCHRKALECFYPRRGAVAFDMIMESTSEGPRQLSTLPQPERLAHENGSDPQVNARITWQPSSNTSATSIQSTAPHPGFSTTGQLTARGSISSLVHTVDGPEVLTMSGATHPEPLGGSDPYPDPRCTEGLVDAPAPTGLHSGFETVDLHSGHGQSVWQSTSLMNFPTGAQNAVIDATYRPEYLGPNLLSSLNWLPTEFLFPDVDIDNYGMQLSPNLIPGLQIDTQSLFQHNENTRVQSGIVATPQDNESPSSFGHPHSVSDYQLGTPGGLSRSSGSEIQHGGFYVDGDGARLPRNGRRRKARPLAQSAHDKRSTDITFAFPDINYLDSEDSAPVTVTGACLDEACYQRIVDCFTQTCSGPSIFSPFQNLNFPNFDAVNRMIQLYILHFHPILPLLHLPTIKLSDCHWILALSLATIGSHYLEIDGSERTVLALHEFLRRAIRVEEERRLRSADRTIMMLIKLLSTLGMLYSGFDCFEPFSRQYIGDLIAYCEHHRYFQPLTRSGETDVDWKNWCTQESEIRIVSSIWLLDSITAYHFQKPSRIASESNISLPCEDPLWDAPTAAAWNEIPCSSSDNLTLHSALQTLYMEKRLPPLGEFAKVNVIHGIFRNMWSISGYLERPLYQWTPVAERSEATYPASAFLLQRDPHYSRWRNASCDAIDVLHWRANSIIATTGTENTTVHHLHFSRLVLLTPYTNILNLALFMAGESQPKSEEVHSDRQRVREWDQFKARLAMIHAGAGFWHVRRYSSGAFYEPSNVFLWTLAIWAYGSFSQLQTNNPRMERDSSPSSSDSSGPTSIRLDRPTDDELVQLYVKNGGSMKATITGVGDISSSKGPYKALKEGRKILQGLTNWGISARYIRILTRLVDKYESSA